MSANRDNARGRRLAEGPPKKETLARRMRDKDFLEYPRMPYLVKHHAGGNDSVQEELLVEFQKASTILIEEKIDGSNIRVCWDGRAEPLVGNRTHVLKKGYIEKDTPAKLQYRPLWNWLYDNKNKFRELDRALGKQAIVYGEWMWAQHTIRYDNLPDWFIPYDIFIDEKMLPAQQARDTLVSAGFRVPHLIIQMAGPQLALDNLCQMAIERVSAYRRPVVDGEARHPLPIEGIVLRAGSDRAKIVSPHFSPRKDFNDTAMLRNSLGNR